MYTYGGLDTENCGDVIAYQPLSSMTYFQFKMDEIKIATHSFFGSWETISDTSTSFIAGPKVITDSIAQFAGATYNDTYEAYFIDCNAEVATISVSIGGIQYEIDGKQVVVDVGNGICEFTFFPINFGGFGPSWVLGDPWIRQYCNIYSYNGEIGFAPTKNNMKN